MTVEWIAIAWLVLIVTVTLVPRFAFWFAFAACWVALYPIVKVNGWLDIVFGPWMTIVLTPLIGLAVGVVVFGLERILTTVSSARASPSSSTAD